MVYFPRKKCYHVSKLCGLLILVVTVLSLFERYRGGKRSTSAATELEVELERQIVEDEARIIPSLGEGGVPAQLEGEGKRLGEESEKQFAINVYLSDRIPYNRTLKDFRNPSCKRVIYDAELPSASVIIIFHNEPYSVVIRTLWSVINSVKRDNPWFRTANYVDKKTGKNMNLGYKGQDSDSPFLYLKEIILVDDNSTLPELKDKLSHYVRTRLPPDLIRILRLPDRVGLTRARLAGARYASGDVLVFLDAHCESQPDWLRPLLQRVKEAHHAVVVPVIDVIESSDFYYSVLDPVVFQGLMAARTSGARLSRSDVLIFLDAHCEPLQDWLRPLLQRITHKPDAVVTPVIDVIDQTTFGLDAAHNFQVGGFTFSGHFIWIDVPEREKKRRGSDISPTWSPTMAGGLFAIKRSYYWELGAYDEQMAGWGGENLEMSFRIWQCGGTLETIPCSRVGHVFRSFHPYGLPAQSDTHGINTARMAEVWMDDYAELFYLHRPDLRRSDKIGDVTHRKVLREKLKCKSFAWYLDNIYKEKFVPVRDVDAFGRFMNPLTGLCLDTLQRESEPAPLGVYPCHAMLQPTQYLSLSLTSQLRDEERCAHVHSHGRRDSPDLEEEGRQVMMMSCRPHQRGQKWRYIPSTQQIQNLESRLCLESPHEAGADVVAKTCSESKREQRWHIDYTENSFENNNVDPTISSQEVKLQKLRGQRRISRSLLSHSENDTVATRRRKNKKNKFVLKLLRSINGTEQHLEADIHCKHRTLYPNDTFVRDIVTILNEKDIKVINNGRVFEKNRVYEVARKKKKNSRARTKHRRPSKRKHHKRVSSTETAPPTSEVTSPPPHPPTSASPSPFLPPAERKIIIEDFVVVTSEKAETTTTARSAFHPKSQLKAHKRRRKRTKPTEEPPPVAQQRARRVSSEILERFDDDDNENELDSDEEEPASAHHRPDDHTDDDASEDADPVFRSRHKKPRGTKRPASSGERSGETEPPLKLVMRSNLTFNLEDELLRTKPDDVASLLGELVIPESVKSPKQEYRHRNSDKSQDKSTEKSADAHNTSKSADKLADKSQNESSAESDSESEQT